MHARLGVREHVESGQTDRPAGGIDGGDGDAGEPQAVQRPFVDEDGGGDAEGDHVREAVELDAEVALRLGHARDPAVERVEEVPEEDGDGRPIEVVPGVLAGGEHDRIDAAENAAHREQAGQDDHQPAQIGAPAAAPLGNSFRHRRRDASTHGRCLPCRVRRPRAKP